MRSIRQVLPILFLATILFLGWRGTGLVRAQDDSSTSAAQDAESVIRAAGAALSAGEAEAFAAYYAGDAVYVALPPPPGTTGVFAGRDAIADLATGVAERNLRVEFTDFHVNGDSATFTALITEDNFTAVGVAPIEFDGTATVQAGTIMAETLIMRPESLAKLIDAENKALVQRLYDEVYNGQAPDILSELVAPDALAEYQAAVAEMQAAYPELTATVDRLLVEGDQVVAVLTFTGTPAGGEPVTWSQVDVHRLADGLLAETSHFGGPPAGAE